MCSSSAQVKANDLALQQADLAQTKLLNSTYATTFAEQQGVLGPLQAKLTYMSANPMGYSAPELAAQRAQINNTTATAAKNAIGAAAAYGAAHGAADVSGGGVAQEVGNIAAAAGNEKAQLLESQAESNAQLKRQQQEFAIEGLQKVGAEYGGASGTAAGNVAGTSGATTDAGEGAIQAGEAGWQTFGSILSGAAGLAEAGVKAWKG
jgi:hypothetical protein